MQQDLVFVKTEKWCIGLIFESAEEGKAQVRAPRCHPCWQEEEEEGTRCIKEAPSWFVLSLSSFLSSFFFFFLFLFCSSSFLPLLLVEEKNTTIGIQGFM